jgi:hypothetical protein
MKRISCLRSKRLNHRRITRRSKTRNMNSFWWVWISTIHQQIFSSIDHHRQAQSLSKIGWCLVDDLSTLNQRSADKQFSRQRQCLDNAALQIQIALATETTFQKVIANVISKQFEHSKHSEREWMMTQLTLFILQYNVRNNKDDIMISLLTNFKIREYDILTIQKSWRNLCVLTSYNSFTIDFHLTYNQKSNVRVCFYVNVQLNVDRWSIDFVSFDVCTIKLKIA